MHVIARSHLGETLWDAFVEQHPGGWFWHTSHWLNYSLAYTRDAVDHSFAIVHEDEVCAVVPLIVNEGRLVCGGQVTPAPIIGATLPDEVAALALEHARESTSLTQPLPIQLRPGIIPAGPIPSGWKMDRLGTQVINLRDSDEVLWRDLRKSYKSLIHKAERDYHISVEIKPYAATLAQWLHQASAKKQTRSDETWQMMGRWMELGHAFVVLASSPASTALSSQTAVGYAFIIRYKDWAYYASGATLVEDLAHALQWRAITTCKQGGLKAYEAGYAAGPHSSEKDHGIAHFKAGFGGREVTLCVISPNTWRPGR